MTKLLIVYASMATLHALLYWISLRIRPRRSLPSRALRLSPYIACLGWPFLISIAIYEEMRTAIAARNHDRA